MNKNSIALFLLIPAALLVIAPLISFPYGFYTLLRLIISITAGIIIYHSYKNAGGINEITILFGVILILYNPGSFVLNNFFLFIIITPCYL